MKDENKKKSAIALKEEEILKFWEDNNIFEKSLNKPNPRGEFVLYDGPPFATGNPHYGHILPTSLKDLIPRFWTMQGYYVARRWGWDCHGLPIENIIEKEIGLESKKDIEKYGLDNFNRLASESVLRCAGFWKKLIPRMGRWVDMENDYRTMDIEYTETIWWIFKNLYEKNLIYEGFKSLHLCPRCETTLSNFEVNQGYSDVEDISVIVKFPLVTEDNTSLLIWTTTPWTLIANVAIAVNPDFNYCQVRQGAESYIVAEELVEKIFGTEGEIVKKITGQELIGLSYQPVFSYYQKEDIDNGDQAWKVYPGEFVNLEEGTGLVHIAPAFGDDDLELAREYSLPLIQHIDRAGRLVARIKDLAGLAVKKKGDTKSLDEKICNLLTEKKYLFKREEITHSYPHCWRCDTPLLNFGSDSWFVKVTDFKDKLLKNNSLINWIPEHIKDGRFGNWLENTRDWAISRSRFWGASIPVWICEDCQKKKVYGSRQELKADLPQASNQYWVMRHGQAESNVLNILSSNIPGQHNLSEEGKQEVQSTAKKLKDSGIDLIIHSPLLRTKQTAGIMAEALNLSEDDMVSDQRLREIEFGELEGQAVDDYINYFSDTAERFDRAPEGGENLKDILGRVGELLFEVEKKYQGRKILFVTHEAVLWLLSSVAKGLSLRQMIDVKKHHRDFVKTADWRGVEFSTLPRNEFGEEDLHRPFIDQAQPLCSCGGKMKRIEDVFDCWFESGAMPYGQKHYPFKEEENFRPDAGIGLPADFIAEGLDQTRGWFYSLLVISTALFDRPAYKNVMVNGIVLAEDGKKLSKRLKNYPEVIDVVDDYGADSLRFYLLSSPVSRGEDLKFSERGLLEVSRRVISRLENVLSFYQTYALQDTEAKLSDNNILDIWMKSRLNYLIAEVERLLKDYQIDRATRLLDAFIDDFSTWYLRRSRSRFKSESDKEKKEASAGLKQVLLNLAQVMAPFTPFIAERVYQVIRSSNDLESVHLTTWPLAGEVDNNILKDMAEVRNICSLALEKRSQAGLKVRQPLASLSVSKKDIASQEQLCQIIAEEINVKDIIYSENEDPDYLELDEHITPELLVAGQLREFLRQVQNLRKKNGFSPQDLANLVVYTTEDFGQALKKDQEDLQRQMSLDSLEISSYSELPAEAENINIPTRDIGVVLTKKN